MTRNTQNIIYVIQLCDKKTKDNVKQEPHPTPQPPGLKCTEVKVVYTQQ